MAIVVPLPVMEPERLLGGVAENPLRQTRKPDAEPWPSTSAANRSTV